MTASLSYVVVLWSVCELLTTWFRVCAVAHVQEVEEDVKKRSAAGEGGHAKTLCMPFDQPELPEGTV